MRTLCLGKPSDRQREFMAANARFVAFGGARGGGKSWAVRAKAVLMALAWPGVVILLIRRSYPELRANHIEPLRKLLGSEFAHYNEMKKEYRFDNGSRILFRFCASEKDMDRYQGTEADIIFIDEATQFEEKVFRMFVACLRGVNGFPKRVYLTCNPGGRGHAWVKRLFVDRVFTAGEDPEDYVFIRSLATDNAALMAAQPDYIRQLEALPPRLRDAWLYGRWDLYEGQFFEEFTDDPDHYEDRAFTHVIEPFVPPRSWRRLRSFDFGYAKPFSMGWWVLDPEGTLYRVAELYGCTGTPDEGVRWTPDRIFAEAAKIEAEHPYLKGCRVDGVADPAIWEASHGPSVADAAAKHGIYFAKGENRRIPGWMQMHYRLTFDENGCPKMYIFKTCRAFLRTVPLLVYSPNAPEDLDTTQEDHVADEARYLCMMNPIPARSVPQKQRPAEDPLELFAGKGV